MAVRGRIPLGFVDAVEDARQRVAAILQHALQPAAQGTRLDLLRVARADGDDRIGKDHARFQEVELAVETPVLVPVEITKDLTEKSSRSGT